MHKSAGLIKQNKQSPYKQMIINNICPELSLSQFNYI